MVNPADRGKPPMMGPWDTALEQLRQWDPDWADTCVKMSTNPWASGVLPRKLVELISLALNVACTNLNPEGMRRHLRAVLDAGAIRDEILLVLKCASVMAIHASSLGAPILLKEAKAAGMQHEPAPHVVTPACDRMKAVGQWQGNRAMSNNPCKSTAYNYYIYCEVFVSD